MILKLHRNKAINFRDAFSWVSILFLGVFVVFNSGDGGISSTSPGLYIAVIALLLFSSSYLLFKKGKLTKSLLKNIFFGIVIISFSGIQAYVNNEEISTVVGRNGFLIVTLYLSSFLNYSNARGVFTLLFALFTFEVILRFASGLASFDGLYSLKRSIFFPDTNFIGVVIAPMVAYLLIMKNRLGLPALVLLVLTASRTAYIGLLSLILALRYPLFSLFSLLLIIIIVLVFRQSIFSILYTLDGSLATKIDIFNNSIDLLTDPYRILFGYGKTGVLDYAIDDVGRQLHVGHTLPGNISQYGLFLPLAVTFYSLKFIPIGYKIPIFVYLMATGLSGLFPYAYLGFMVILFKSTIIALEYNN